MPAAFIFPCGTPDPSDVAADKVDFDHSIVRELTEETGLEADDFAAEPAGPIVQERCAARRLQSFARAASRAGSVRARRGAHRA